jgi:hypothetical protein
MLHAAHVEDLKHPRVHWNGVDEPANVSQTSRGAGRPMAIELFPLPTHKSEVSEAPVSLQKSAGQPLKRKVHDLHLVLPREAMDPGAGDVPPKPPDEALELRLYPPPTVPAKDRRP